MGDYDIIIMARLNQFYLLPYCGDSGVYDLQFIIIDSLKASSSEAISTLRSYGGVFPHKKLLVISKLAAINLHSSALQDLYERYSQSLRDEDWENHQQIIRDAANDRTLDHFVFKPYVFPGVCRSPDHKEFVESLLAVIRDSLAVTNLIKSYSKISWAEKWYLVSDFASINSGCCAANQLKSMYIQALKGVLEDFIKVREEVKSSFTAEDREIWGLGGISQQIQPIDLIVMFGIAWGGAGTVPILIDNPWKIIVAISVLLICQLVFYYLYKFGVRRCQRRS